MTVLPSHGVKSIFYGCVNTTETELELSNNPLVGDIVVFKEGGSARCWWKLAKVTELLKSRDNVVRSAKIQVLNTDAQRRPTVLRRPVQHLIPLEVNHSLEMLKNVDYLRSLLFKYI